MQKFILVMTFAVGILQTYQEYDSALQVHH